ncbi:SGNH/GDSL hydrolase family protein [Nocardioides sp. C4-1]|uniref:SGNH/GDSL hydrolase family protein n=1 Tax=Nocardioides sp. C4-1 TaxID=3151851 RepID=UPI003262E83D
MTRRTLACLLSSAVLLTGCGGSGSEPDDAAPTSGSTSADSSPTEPAEPSSTSAPADGPSYVALGDSFAAAPGVPTTSPADGCFRSDANYAHVLAETAGLTLTDVTCSGATTGSVLADQVPVLDETTDLVTLGVGGNDENLFASLLQRCFASADPDAPGTPCTDLVGADVDRVLPVVADNVATLLDAVVAAAPNARVVVVGYPGLVPDEGTCPDLLPIAAGDYPLVERITTGLSDALRAGAEANDLDFVDLAGPSRGHDVCSAEPWVNGAVTSSDDAAPLHPFAVEQAAVADLLRPLVP